LLFPIKNELEKRKKKKKGKKGKFNKGQKERKEVKRKMGMCGTKKPGWPGKNREVW